MNRYAQLFVLAALSLLALGCDSGGHKEKSAAAPATQYGVSVVAIDAVNKDTGEALVVDGVPVNGGTVNIDPNP
jgi:predicted component of type VI protein secretion system